LAVAYDACISAANRRRLGTVFTPDDVVDYMLDRVEEQLDEEPACVVDPGAGVGAFTLAAARRWPMARIVAVDINVVTLGLLAARVCYERSVDADFASRPGEIEVRLADYLDELPDLFARDAPGPVVALGNPPYTRTQALSADYKSRAAKLADGMITSGHANLAILFQATTVAQMRPTDVSCMVLPGSVVYTRAARDLRAAIWRGTRPVTVHRWPAAARAFAGRDVQAAVITLGPENKADPGPIRLARAETQGGRVQLIEEWALDRKGEPVANWYWTGKGAEDEDAVALPDVAKIRRGVATGANSVFFLDDAAAARMPDRLILPAVSSLRRFAGEVLTKEGHRTWGPQRERRWLLAIDPDERLGARVSAHLEHDPEVAERHLCTQREPWWSITDRPRPDILLGPLSKTHFKVVLNEAGAIPSNNLIGITVVGGSARPLADWLRSDAGQAELRRVSRKYHGGSLKVEPGDIRKVRVPRSVVSEMKPHWRGVPTKRP
jgi:adenine-specific DNA-methyltransferase